MSMEETRHLGVEFERRVQTMIPEKEYLDKLDTQTIYSYINLYQDKFIHDLYKSLDSIPSPSKISARVELILLGLLTHQSFLVTKKAGLYEHIQYLTMPSNFGMYLHSTSIVDDVYSYKKSEKSPGIIQNLMLSLTDFHNILQTPVDSMRIMRNPVAAFSEENGIKTISIMYDRYTAPTSVDVAYYRIPQYADLMTSTPCELPMDVFDDLVSGAVDLYVQYVAGAEARKRAMQEQQLKQAKRNNEDEDERS